MLNKFYQKQQLIMTMLGYYDGVCDGVWGPKCVAAKRQWEFEDNFEPAVPSNGLPFVGRGKLPRGMNYTHKGLDILWDKWDQSRAEEILASEKGQMLTAQHVHDHVMQAQEQAQDVTVEPQIQARGPQQSQPHVSTLKPFEQAATPEPEVESDEEEDEEIADENLSDNKASEGQDATSNQKEQKQDWLQKKRK